MSSYIKLGLNGLIQIDIEGEYFYTWENIVGINAHHTRSEIYTKTGDVIRLKNSFVSFKRYRIYDYGNNNIDEGQPDVLHSWREIFPRIKKYVQDRGGCYIPEFETLYTAWLYILPGLNDSGKMQFSKNEKRDIRLFHIIYPFFLFAWIVGLVFIFSPINPIQKIIPIHVLFIFFIVVLVATGIVTFRFFSKKKIRKILNCHDISSD